MTILLGFLVTMNLILTRNNEATSPWGFVVALVLVPVALLAVL